MNNATTPEEHTRTSTSAPVFGEETVGPSDDVDDKLDLEDVGSSYAQLQLSACLSCVADIPSEIPPKSPTNLVVVACTSFTIYPMIQVADTYRKTYIKMADVLFALLISSIVFWSYRELQRLL